MMKRRCESWKRWKRKDDERKGKSDEEKKRKNKETNVLPSIRELSQLAKRKMKEIERMDVYLILSSISNFYCEIKESKSISSNRIYYVSSELSYDVKKCQNVQHFAHKTNACFQSWP